MRERLKRGGAIDSRELMQMPNGRTVTVGGLVTVRQRPSTAGGTIFLLLEDEHGYANIVVSKALVEENEEVVKRAPFVLVQGRVENDGSAISIVGKRFRELDVGPLDPSRARVSMRTSLDDSERTAAALSRRCHARATGALAARARLRRRVCGRS